MTKAKCTGLLVAGGLMVVAVLVCGCASDKPKPPPQAAAEPAAPPPKPVGLGQIKTELLEAKAQIDATTSALNTLQKSAATDAQANYNKFSEEFMKLQKKQESVKARAEDLKSKTEAYYATWNKQVEVQNPELRRQAVQQRSDAQQVYNSISSDMELARIAFAPYVRNLNDIGAYLRGNVTPASLWTVKDLTATANDQSKQVNTHIDSIVSAIDKLSAATGEGTTPAVPAASPTPAPAVPAQ